MALSARMETARSSKLAWTFTFLFLMLITISSIQTLSSGPVSSAGGARDGFAIERRQDNNSASGSPSPSEAASPPASGSATPTTPAASSPAASSPAPSDTGNSGATSKPEGDNGGSNSPTPSQGDNSATPAPSDAGTANQSPSPSPSPSPAPANSPPAQTPGAAASTPSPSPAPAGGATTPAAGSTPAASSPPASSAPPPKAEKSTSLGKPVTLKPTTQVTDQATVVSMTGADGKPSVTTKHILSTFVTAPVSTPRRVFTPTQEALRPTSTGPASSGMSAGAKAATGVLVPLLAISAGVGIAAYLIKKKRKQRMIMNGDYDAEKRPHIHIAPAVAASDDDGSYRGFGAPSSGKSATSVSIKSLEATLPPVQPRSPAVSMMPPAHPFSDGGLGAGAGAGAAAAAAIASHKQSSGDAGPFATPPQSAGGLPLGRSNSAVSSITTVSSTSRYSRGSHYSHYSTYSYEDGRTRTPSPPPPLPEMMPQDNRFLEYLTPHSGPAIGNTASTLNPFVDPPSPGKSQKANKRLSSAYFHGSEGSIGSGSQSTITDDRRRSSAYTIPDLRNGPFISGVGAASGTPVYAVSNVQDPHVADASNRYSIISDASVADPHGPSAASAPPAASASGDAIVTPGGRVVPKPVLPTPVATSAQPTGHNVNAGVYAPTSKGTSTAMKRRSSYSATAPRLPQLVEEDSSFGFSFDLASSNDLSGAAARPQTSPEEGSAARVNSSGGTSPSVSPPPSRGGTKEGSDGGRSDGQGLRGRALSSGYRRYRPDNL